MTIGLGPHGSGVLRWVSPGVYLYHCPGCEKGHTFNVHSRDRDGTLNGFDGDTDKPTVEGVLTFDGCTHALRAGTLHYMQDCRHALAGQSIPLEPYPGH